MDDFKDSPTALVADVDCTAEGKDLCNTHGVKGYPSIKYGEPGDLKDYQGGRSYEDLKKFADENLGPTCGPTNLDLCSADVKAKIEGFVKMTADRLEGKIRNAEKVLAEEVPLMKKVLASKGSKEKGEL
uniref:Thioredoxin domain-containing protein n=1 Tax=Alexandrium catenella TaxID=2925 RepID=A0A7S1RU61_ALECA|mmetsp:Transcript_73083/g.194154  ORF Transcript_73083/g.194154 Transcript_73083/m.194154 type:complete len:129 (+) Transcript_73083:2-388(+)